MNPKCKINISEKIFKDFERECDEEGKSVDKIVTTLIENYLFERQAKRELRRKGIIFEGKYISFCEKCNEFEFICLPQSRRRNLSLILRCPHRTLAWKQTF